MRFAAACHPPRLRACGSVAGKDAVDQFLHRRDKAVRVERVGREAVGTVAGEHEVVVDVAAVGDVLQRLLDAEAARVGQAAGGVGFAIHPAGEGALAEAAHAIGLVLQDLAGIVGLHEDQRIVRGAHGLREALRFPLQGLRQLVRLQVDQTFARTDAVRFGQIARGFGGIGDLPFRPRAEFFHERVVHGAGVETGRAEPVQEDVAFLQGQ